MGVADQPGDVGHPAGFLDMHIVLRGLCLGIRAFGNEARLPDIANRRRIGPPHQDEHMKPPRRVGKGPLIVAPHDSVGIGRVGAQGRRNHLTL